MRDGKDSRMTVEIGQLADGSWHLPSCPFSQVEGGAWAGAD